MANKELNKKVSVREIKEAFHLKQICGDDSSLDRWAVAPDVNRPGLELAGVKIDTDLKRVLLIGNKEMIYLKSVKPDVQKDRFDFITDKFTPCIILTDGLKAPKALVDVAKAKNFPVLVTKTKTYLFTTEVVGFLSDKLAPSISVHGEMLNIYGKGVLVIGKSGVGKSELALDLISRGHMLVADDLVEMSRVNNYIKCSAPENIKGMLEVRGIGIIDVKRIYGGYSFLDNCGLDFIIQLVSADEYDKQNNDRLNPLSNVETYFDIPYNKLVIPMTVGKTMSVIIETAVINFILKQSGFDSNESFKENIKQQIIKKAGK